MRATVVIYILSCVGNILGVEDTNRRRQNVSPGVRTDVCANSLFHAECQQDHVINVTYAQYGRLSGSICGTGSGRCEADVLGQTDYRCSGRQQCNVEITNADFDNADQCLLDIRPYFKVTYECIQVTPLRDVCVSSNPVIAIQSDPQFISGHLLSQYGCRGKSISLQAAAGQQIKISLTDFTWRRSPLNEQCLVDVTDGHYGRTVTLCRGQGHKEFEVMSSLSHTVVLRVNSDDWFNVLKVQALGCPDLPTSQNTWMKRESDNMTIGCRENDDQWSLVCRDGQWRGHRGNCSSGSATSTNTMKNGSSTGSSLPSNIWIAIIVAVAAIVSILVTTVGIVCYKKSSVKQEYYATTLKMHYDTLKRAQRLQAQAPTAQSQPMHTMNGTYQPQTPQPATASEYTVPPYTRPPQRQSSRECTYESIHIMDQPIPTGESGARLPPPPIDLLQTDRRVDTIQERGSSSEVEESDDDDDDDTRDQASSSDESNSELPKYYVLDKDMVERHLMDQSLSDA